MAADLACWPRRATENGNGNRGCRMGEIDASMALILVGGSWPVAWRRSQPSTLELVWSILMVFHGLDDEDGDSTAGGLWTPRAYRLGRLRGVLQLQTVTLSTVLTSPAIRGRHIVSVHYAHQMIYLFRHQQGSRNDQFTCIVSDVRSICDKIRSDSRCILEEVGFRLLYVKAWKIASPHQTIRRRW